MIPVFTTSENTEAHRIHHGLKELGIVTQLIEGLDAPNDSYYGVALAHVSCIGKLRAKPGLSSLIAFGGADQVEAAVKTMQQGASEYLPIGAHLGRVTKVIESFSHLDCAESSTAISSSVAMTKILTLARKVAQADIAVLISGESGTGKEVIAREVHRSSTRSQAPFIAVNCAAIPETMLEAILFGHEKGAFTGATEKRLGKFELADGGTLLLDEITEMPTALQAKLLRVLQEREVERIGSNKPTKIDVRVLATSNRNLAQAIVDGHLREDLYYRLSVFPLTVPALRNRRSDILPLAEHFLRKHGCGKDYSLDEKAQQILQQHSWPGNVRELENSIQRGLVLCSESVVTADDLCLEAMIKMNDLQCDSLHEQLRGKGEELLLETLEANNGVRKSTALQLGISERTLRYKLKELRERGILI